jgi:pimeloyl-ACP methyl ester carboxylesterase
MQTAPRKPAVSDHDRARRRADHHVTPASARVASHREKVGGVELHWLESGHGTPAVFLHGLGNNAYVWRRVMPRLSRLHVIAPDLPGFGQSEQPRHRPLLLEYVRIIGELIDRVAPGEPVALVGNSVGGAVALRLALDRPARVSRLVLVDPAGAGSGVPEWWQFVHLEPVVRWVSAPLLLAAPPWLIEAVVGRAYREMAFSDPHAVSERAVRIFTRQFNTRKRIDHFLAAAHDLVDSFEREVQKREGPMSMPVLVVWGRDDRVVPLHDALALLERIEAAELRIIERAGHLPHLERPQEFVSAVSGFLCGAPLEAGRGGESLAIAMSAVGGNGRR